MLRAQTLAVTVGRDVDCRENAGCKKYLLLRGRVALLTVPSLLVTPATVGETAARGYQREGSLHLLSFKEQ